MNDKNGSLEVIEEDSAEISAISVYKRKNVSKYSPESSINT